MEGWGSPPTTQPPPGQPVGRRWWEQARNLWIIIGLLGLLLVGSIVAVGVIAASQSDEADRELAEARDEIASERDRIASERRALQEEKAEVQEQIDTLREDAAQARSDARREEKKLARLRDQVRGVHQQIDDRTIPGTGTYVVGEDIQPGTYRAKASPGCYWARLSSLDTSDIIDNNNADGPVVIEVLSSDKALELSNCADFVRQGG
jgi:hypothetical protein